jgi:hypothetical protein
VDFEIRIIFLKFHNPSYVFFESPKEPFQGLNNPHIYRLAELFILQVLANGPEGTVYTRS